MGLLGQYDKDQVFHFFEEISKIPRGSGNEKAVSDYIMAFAKSKNLYARQDEVYNVVVKKPATKGYETAKPVILQGHLDMVCEKNGDKIHDFEKDPLTLHLNGDFLSADHTTLGADNGIAVAYMLALLNLERGNHPALELIFTTDEEAGMGGATAFDPFDIEGKRFINLDTGEEGVLLSGCSGGKKVKVVLPIEKEKKPDGTQVFHISITGLKGGHSGVDIHHQRANANCLMGRFLYALEQKMTYALISINGGLMDNAICREAKASVMLSPMDRHILEKQADEMTKLFQEEYDMEDKNIKIQIEASHNLVQEVLSKEVQKKVISLLMLLPYGVQSMVMGMNGLVESSNNIGIVKTQADCITFDNAVRSSVKSRKELIVEQIRLLAEQNGATIEEAHDYPGWKYNPESLLLQQFAMVYKQINGNKPEISAVHAGLECGLFGEKIEGLDMISIGPDMFDIHTPDERLSVASTMRVWEFLKAVLKSF